MNALARRLSLLLALSTVLLYLPVRHNSFVYYDDPEYLTHNPVVQQGLSWAGVQWAFCGAHAANWHPLTWLSHMLDCELFGLDPGAHHMVSVFIHAANAVLLALLIFRMTGAPWAGALVAALFAWHPLRVESVAWASERKDVLSTLFFLLTILAYVAKTSPSSQTFPVTDKHPAQTPKLSVQATRPLLLPLLFFALGLMSKPMVVTLPMVLLLLDYWPLERARLSDSQSPVPTWRRLFWEKWPFFAFAGASCVITYLSQREEAVSTLENVPLELRLSNAVVSYARYLFKMIWPIDLAAIYPMPQQWPAPIVAGAGVLLLFLSWSAWRWRREHPHLLVGWLWYLGTLVPVIGLVQVGSQAMADRYTYIPQIGILMGAIFEARFWVRRLRIGMLTPSLGAAAALAGCVAVTLHQMPYWADSQSLFTHALAVTRDNAAAHAGLAFALADSGRMQDALSEYQQALKLNPASAELYNDIGNVLDKLGRPEEALRYYQETLRLKPRPVAHLNLGMTLARLGRYEKAMNHFSEEARLAPLDPRSHICKAQALLWQGRSADAVAEFRAALELDPNEVETLLQLARVLAADQDPKARNGRESLAVAGRADALTGGGRPVVLDTLAMAYAECGQFAEARESIQKAIERVDATGQKTAAEELQQRLRLYQQGHAYRETFKRE